MKLGYEITAGQIAGIFQEVKRVRPLIHMIPNTVSAALCADGLSALGARPLMAVAAQEMAEITQQADGSVINLGQLDLDKLEAARIVLNEVDKLKKPVVLDPVGCGASYFRLESVQELLALPWQGMIKGNCSEIYSIQQNQITREGIDAVAERKLSEQIPGNRVYLVTGEADLVLWDGKRIQLSYGREHCSGKISRYNIVGSGCLAGAIAGACYSIVSASDMEDKTAKLVAAAATSFGMAFSLEKASLVPGYGKAKAVLLDSLCELATKEFESWLVQRLDKVRDEKGE